MRINNWHFDYTKILCRKNRRYRHFISINQKLRHSFFFGIVGVEDEAGQRLAAPDGHAEGGESEICVDAVGEGVADDLLCAKVFHNSAVEPALAGGDIGNIADPCGVWLVKGEAARKEIGRDGVRVS